MAKRYRALIVVALMAALLLLHGGCYPNPQPPGLTPVPTLPAGITPTAGLLPFVTLPAGTIPAPALKAQTPLGQTPTLLIPQSLGQLAPFSPEIQTVAPPTSAAGAPTAAPAPIPVAAGQPSAAVGALLFMEGCVCHGNQGQGIDAPALRNSQFVQTAGDQAVYTVIAFGRNNTRMPAWLLGQGGPLTDAQVQSVVGYLRTLQGVPALPTATPGSPSATSAPTAAQAEPTGMPTPTTPAAALSLTGDVGRGRAAFGPFCSSCHGPEGLSGIANPGSDSGTVPVLNPIEAKIADLDPKVFAAQAGGFVQHGSTPSGRAPQILMPAFGDTNMLTQQQIADLIAYVIFLNRTCPGRTCS